MDGVPGPEPESVRPHIGRRVAGGLTKRLAIGLLLLGYGIWAITDAGAHSNNRPTCAGNDFRPGEVCENFSTGKSQTYSEALAATRGTHPGYVVTGTIAMIIGVVIVVWQIRIWMMLRRVKSPA